MEIEFNLIKFLDQLKQAREIATGFGATPSELTNKNFEMLDPETLDFLRRYAILHIANDQHKLKLYEQMPEEIRNWPIEADMPILLAATQLNILNEAFAFVQKRFRESIGVKDESKDPMGFGQK